MNSIGVSPYNMTTNSINVQTMNVDAYLNTMKQLCDQGISEMKSKNWTYYVVPVKFMTEIAGTEFHILHYGKKLSYQKWNDRTLYSPPPLMPFRVLQRHYLEMGYYLLDESDNTKSNRPFIVIYAQPKENVDPLWHGYNVSPQLF